MSRVLEELWYGNITPIDRSFKRGTEFDESVRMVSKNESKLEVLLDNAAKETFEKYREAQQDVTRISECETFISGFRLGARIIMEALIDDDGIFTDV